MATNPAQRRDFAKIIRVKTAELAFNRGVPEHKSNGDEEEYPNRIGSFTKCLPHDIRTGNIVDPDVNFGLFVKSIDTGKASDQRAVMIGPPDGNFISKIALDNDAKKRGWESSGAGLIFELQGSDSHAVTMPPAPKLTSKELVLEMTELYCMALLRDCNFSEFNDTSSECGQRVAEFLPYINEAAILSENPRGPYTAQTVFRGTFPGETIGPLISQFLLIGTKGIDRVHPRSIADGLIQYGSITIDQRVKVATPGKNYGTTWAQYMDVQNGADLIGTETYEDEVRFITTPRDLATYVHHDALYQSYLDACIILLGLGAKFDDGIPFQEDDCEDKQRGFASWGGPHILTLLTEVSTRALHAIRYQKFNVHRRPRPERIGGLIDRYLNSKDPSLAPVEHIATSINKDLLCRVAENNAYENSFPDRKGDFDNGHSDSYLFPQAFVEGSPSHPSYGAGHASVGGACVTILKAFFDTEQELGFAFEASPDGSKLQSVPGCKLKVGHELNKLAANIGIGRDWAGVHYYTDWTESAKLGEQIALSILEEQAFTYPDDFHMTIPTFEDGCVRIEKQGNVVSVTKNGKTTSNSFF